MVLPGKSSLLERVIGQRIFPVRCEREFVRIRAQSASAGTTSARGARLLFTCATIPLLVRLLIVSSNCNRSCSERTVLKFMNLENNKEAAGKEFILPDQLEQVRKVRFHLSVCQLNRSS